MLKGCTFTGKKDGALLRQVVHAAETLGLGNGANLILCNTFLK